MKRDKIKLLWPVSNTGHSWVTGTAVDYDGTSCESRRWLTDGLPPEAPKTSFAEIEPFSIDSALFLNFCLADQSEESIKDFADKYGSLGESVKRLIKVHEPNDPSLDCKEVIGESFEDWTRETENLEFAVQLCYGILEKHRKKDVGVAMFFPINRTDSEQGQRYTLRKAEITDVDAALAELDELISSHLECFLTMQEGHFDEENWLSLAFQTHSLLSGLWLQFAIAVSERKVFHQCKQCLRWFEIEPGQRTSRVFCSGSCKYKAYQERQETAVRLRSEGMTIEDIATKVNSNPWTVERWVKEREGNIKRR